MQGIVRSFIAAVSSAHLPQYQALGFSLIVDNKWTIFDNPYLQLRASSIIHMINSTYYIIINSFNIIRIQMLCVFTLLAVVCMGQAEDGPKKYFYPNGQVSSEGVLVNGRPEGYWKSYYADGVLKSEGNRTRSQLDSTWRFYAPDGRLTTTIDYRADQKNGLTRKFAEDGSLLSEETFVGDIKDGVTTTFHPNGKVHIQTPFKDGKEEGKAVEYEVDGRIITLFEYRAGLLRSKEMLNRYDDQGWRQGLWREYWPNGKPKWEGRFVDDKRQGIFKEFDANGTLRSMDKFDQDVVQDQADEVKLLSIRNSYHGNGKVSSIGSFSKQGTKEGLFRYFDDGGLPTSAAIYQGDRKMSEGEVSDVGALQGHWIEYYGTGEKRAEGEYKDGRKDGPWTFYHREGQVEQKGVYVAGLPQGEWVWFFTSGARHREERYRKGREDGASAEYDTTGAVITQGEYIDGMKDGPWLYNVGDHKEVGAYKDGLKDGEWVHTYVNGKRNFVGAFVNGDPKGKHRWWWPNGELKQEARYVGGLLEGDVNHYDEFGNLVLTIKYKNGAEMKLGEAKLPPPYEAGDFVE
jgi:antitoxin component YwqK of YwqJK toxin-antitoxin module